MSLFWKLWLSLALAFGLLTGALGLGEYTTLQRALVNETDRNLQVRALWLVSQFDQGKLPQGLMVPPQHHILEELGKVFVEVVDSQGRIVRRSSNLDNQSLPGQFPPGTYFRTVSTPEGHPFRVHQLAGRRGLVRVGESLELVERSLSKSVIRIFALGVLTFLLAAYFCYRVLDHICRPLEALAQNASAIAESGEVRRRLEGISSIREVSQVSSTINGLLDRVESLLQAQERLLQDTSHELRNPLTVLKMDLELLARPDLDVETRAEIGHEVQGELSRLIQLVEGLLLISWAETNPPIEVSEVALESLFQQLGSRYQNQLSAHQLQFKSGVGSVLAERGRLEQICRNLIDNALRYAGESAQIRLWWVAHDELEASWIPADRLRCAAGELLLVVEDNGPGIDPAHWDRLFERYFRLEADRNRQAGGVGLGLPIARALARAMGGDLTVYSQPGRGCAFLLRLPGLA